MVREALVYILQHHLLAISNCCSMLETARQASIASLADRALGLLCGNYMHMLQCHGSTLGELSQETLMLVLCHDNLQVGTFEGGKTPLCDVSYTLRINSPHVYSNSP